MKKEAMMSKVLIIIILILIIIGLYFSPQITKAVIKGAGQATANVAKDIKGMMVNSSTFQEMREGLIEENTQTEKPSAAGK